MLIESMNIAIIPARGGSKRIPKKNIKSFHGKPMLSYPISVATKTGLFDRIIVSTDCDEIKHVAEAAGAAVPFKRPAELADDHTGTGAVIGHAVQWLSEHSVIPEFVCCIYPTTPLLTAEDIVSAYQLLLDNPEKLYAFSVCRYAYPVSRALRLNEQGEISMLFPEYETARSQDLSEVFHDAGQFYWGRREAFLSGISMFGSESLPYFLPRYQVVDIDDEEDWIEAEKLFRV